MHPSVIGRVLGQLLLLFSVTMLTPIVVALIYGESTVPMFLLAFAITAGIGAGSWWLSRHTRPDLRTRDGFVITVLFWLVLGTFGALPLMLAEAPHLAFTDAVFESISGLTTTGATVITHLDSLPRSILYYRQQLQWLGGIGIVVIAVAILPMLGVGGMQLYRAETPGPMKDSKLKPRITETANLLFRVYVVLTLACAIAYYLAGMEPFDAICHSFSTVAIGGFSTHDASLGFYDSSVVMLVAMVFMVLAGLNFALHYLAWSKKSLLSYWKDPEARLYLLLLMGGGAVTVAYLYFTQVYNFEQSLLHGAFQFISIMTTTGFATADFGSWPTFLPFFLLFASFFGACAGSTGGGIKISRMLILGKQCLREIYRLVHPSAVLPIKIRGRVFPERVADGIWAFFGAYLAIYYFIVLLLLASGLDYVTAWSATAAALNNLGPGLGDVALNYSGINDFAKWVLCAGMLLGRLEIFTLLVLFSPTFWRS